MLRQIMPSPPLHGVYHSIMVPPIIMTLTLIMDGVGLLDMAIGCGRTTHIIHITTITAPIIIIITHTLLHITTTIIQDIPQDIMHSQRI